MTCYLFLWVEGNSLLTAVSFSVGLHPSGRAIQNISTHGDQETKSVWYVEYRKRMWDTIMSTMIFLPYPGTDCQDQKICHDYYNHWAITLYTIVLNFSIKFLCTQDGRITGDPR
jgi:hypothetical protein